MKAFQKRLSSGRPLVVAFALVLLSAASSARAAVPAPPNCTSDLVIVGNLSGDVVQSTNGCSPRGPGYSVIVRDVLNAPIANAFVTLDFSTVAAIRLSPAQESGTTVNCAAKTISRLTNAAGLARFAPRFGGYVNNNAVRVSADGVILALVRARSTDIDGAGATTGLGDFALFAANFALQAPTPETDFDDCASGPVGTGLTDFAIFTVEFRQNVAGAYCP